MIEHIHEDAKMEEKENENGEKEMVETEPAKEKVKIKKRPVSLSDIHPLWTKHPNECSDEDYLNFYRKVFMDYKEPLFWIHLNMDYPFNLKGILYFPRINTEYEMEEGSKQEVGSTMTLYLNEDSLEFANEYRMREVLEKYCSFMPVEIFLSKANAEPEYETIDEADLKDDDEVIEHIHEDAKMEEKENENGEKEMVETEPAKEKVKIKKRPVSLSDIHPLWTKHPLSLIHI